MIVYSLSSKASANAGRHNNGMHPTANSAALIRETPCLYSCERGG